MIEGLPAAAPMAVVCDGCRTPLQLDPAHASRLATRLEIDPMRFSKRGIVSGEVGANYDRFKRRLRDERPGLALVELEAHHGFAFAVREGLLWAQAAGCSHALVCQHDRTFIRRVSADVLEAVLAHFDEWPSCRYVGFPSGTSKRLALRTARHYGLATLLEARTRPLAAPPSSPSRLMLRPCIFWYDSNHLVHCGRALRLLFEPDPASAHGAPRTAGFSAAPAALRARLGGAGAARFRLRKGDFIEERFGVEQRALLASLRHEPLATQLEAFDHFGAYILEEVAALPPAPDAAPRNPVRSRPRADPRHASAGVCTPAPPRGFGWGQVDAQGLVTHVEHIDARGKLPPSQRRAGAVREARRDGRAPNGRWGGPGTESAVASRHTVS